MAPLKARWHAIGVILQAKLIGVAVGLSLLAMVSICTGEADQSDEASKELSAKQLNTMRQLAQRVHVFTSDGDGGRSEIAMGEEPLLRFSDYASIRKFRDGTVWAFGTKGRPVMLLTLERYQSHWSYEFISLAESANFSADFGNGRTWSPDEPGIKPELVPGMPPVSSSKRGRLTQAKAIARRFEAWDVGELDNKRYELRLMPKPLVEYSDEVS